jgi:hypothetical protein
MESFYADAGFQTHIDGAYRTFETDAAIAIQHLVEREMDAKPSRTDDAKADHHESVQGKTPPQE